MAQRVGCAGIRQSDEGLFPAVTVGTLDVRLAIWQSTSLKDKRRVVQSVLQRMRNEFNVSAIESGTRDVRQHASLYFANVGDNRRGVESTLTKVVSSIQRRHDVKVVDFDI